MTTVDTQSRIIDNELKILIKARYPLIYLLSFEERRVEDVLQGIARDMGKQLLVWTVTQGFVETAARQFQPNTNDPVAALDFVLKTPSHGAFLYVLKDFHPFLDKDKVIQVRKLRDAVHHVVNTDSSVLILSPVLRIPTELEKTVTIVEFPLPSKEDFEQLIDAFSRNYEHATVSLDTKTRDAITAALLGLTTTEAENVLSRAMVTDNRLDARDLPLIIKEKEQIIKKSGVLEFYSLKEGVDDVGGLSELKKWVSVKRRVFDKLAGGTPLDSPKGALLIGVPGCGKSLMAKAVANSWKMPLLRFDLGKLFGMYVGQSEENIRRAISTAESVAPCVLWIDEIEKGFSGAGASDLDSGVTARVFGTFITWLNEKQKPVFVVATANDISRLPPELMRKGRFDEIFFVDLPNEAEREEIFTVHLNARGLQANKFDLKRLGSLSAGYTGSDIEGVVKAAREAALVDGGRELRTDDIARAIEETLPLSVTLKERIESLRSWARTRARPASTPWEQVPIPAEDDLLQRRKNRDVR